MEELKKLGEKVERMLKEAEKPGIIKEWADFAKEDLRVSRLLYLKYPHSSFYHFQQAIEKTTKAAAMKLGFVKEAELATAYGHDTVQFYMGLLIMLRDNYSSISSLASVMGLRDIPEKNDVDDAIKTLERLKKKKRERKRYLFSVELRYKRSLEKCLVGCDFRDKLSKNGLRLSDNAIVARKGEKSWAIIDGNKEFTVEEKNVQLSIYEKRKEKAPYFPKEVTDAAKSLSRITAIVKELNVKIETIKNRLYYLTKNAESKKAVEKVRFMATMSVLVPTILLWLALATWNFESMERYPYPRRRFEKKLSEMENAVKDNYDDACEFLEFFLQALGG